MGRQRSGARSAVTFCHRWTETTSPGMRSRKAFRLSRPGSSYRLSSGIQDDLIHAHADDPPGEARHPMEVIRKRNERGASGIGASPMEFLQPARIRLATRTKVADAPCLKPIEPRQAPGRQAVVAPPPVRNLPGRLLHR